MNKAQLPLALALALAALAAGAATAATPRIFPYTPHVETLDNGLKVILVPIPADGLLSYWTVVRTGSRDEVEPGHSGFAHFFEHMMFRGTEKFPAEVYNDIMTKLGASTNASTSDDLTIYYASIAAEDLATVVELEADRFMNLSYPEGAFKTEAGAVYGEYRKNRTSPFSVLNEAIREKAFERHTYGHTTMGYEADIKAMPTMYEYSKSFFQRFYRPENCVVMVTGDLDIGRTMVLLRQHYGGWKRGYQQPAIPAEPEQTAEKRLEVSFAGQTLPILWLAYKGEAADPGSRSQAALSLLLALAFGETSDLYKKLVLEEQSVEFLNADGSPSRDPGLIDILAMVRDEAKIGAVEAAIDAAITRFQRDLPDEQRLAEIKNRVRYSFLLSLDTPDRVAQSLAGFVALHGGIERLDESFGTVSAVTPQEIRDAARKFLQPTRRTVGILRGAKP